MTAALACTTSFAGRTRSPFRVVVALAASAAIASACDPGGLSAPAARPALDRGGFDAMKVEICHLSEANAAIHSVSIAALPAHRRHGDYVTGLEVGDAVPPGDRIHFRRLTDALAEARAGRLERGELESAACRITIAVAAGIRPGSTSASSADPAFERFPFVIDVPDITVRGALRMQLDEVGRATGVSETGQATVFAPSPMLLIIGGTGGMSGSPEPIFSVNGHPDGSKGNGTILEGFVFQSGRTATDLLTGGFGIFAIRVRDLVVRGNKFETGLLSGVDLRASTALVEGNHLSGRGSSCDICLAGPGDYVARGNRIIFGGTPGILILPVAALGVLPPAEPYVLPATSLLTAVIENNEVRDHLRVPVGVGIRIGAVGVGVTTAPSNVISASTVTLRDNELVNNTFGIIIEAGFPRDGTMRRGDLDVTVTGNRISRSCQNDILVSLANSQTGLGIQNQPYLLGSTYTLVFGPEIPWESVWYANAAGFGNTLTVNGEVVPNGVRRAYAPTRVCTP